MTVHYVKSWLYLYSAAITGMKTHDMRRQTDRDYKVGDVMILQEYDQNKYCYTGREAAVQITYITSPENPCALSGNGLKEEYVILSIKLIGELKDKDPVADSDKEDVEQDKTLFPPFTQYFDPTKKVEGTNPVGGVIVTRYWDSKGEYATLNKSFDDLS